MRTETKDRATRRHSNGGPPPAIDAAVLRTPLELGEIFPPRVLDPEEPAPEAPTCGLPKRGSETILLVEDEPAVRALVQRVLARAGYHVITAENGDEALLKAERYEGVIDLLVSDVTMPGLNGYQVAAALRRARPALTVILMSGYSEEAVKGTSGAHGAACYIGKPFSPRDLVSAVRDTLRHVSRC